MSIFTMDVISPPETRGRSRSKTPFLRSSCDREACTHIGEGHVHERKLKKSPQVQTIIEEESYTRYTPDRKTQQAISSRMKASKVKTSDYSSDDISPENSRTRSNVKTVTITTSTETLIAGGQHSSQYRNASSRLSQVMSPIDKISSKETTQNDMNSAFEESIKTSTPITTGNSSSSSRKIQFASNTTTNGQAGEHVSYQEYKKAGEYWNKYPKTDYTYSRLSPHRREIAPGYVAMPNMSRKSLDKHNERVDVMIRQNPSQESYILRRYADNRQSTTKKSSSTKVLRSEVQYDSQDEVDLTEYDSFERRRRYMQYNSGSNIVYKQSFITRILTTIVSLFYSVTGVFWKNEADVGYYTTFEEKRGFFGRILSNVSSLIVTAFRPLYLFISSMLYADTLLLRSSNPDNRGKKRFLIILLLLLPLLLLAGLQYYLNPNYIFPPVLNITSITFPTNFNHLKVDTIEKYEELKTNTIEKVQNFVVFSEDYLTYFKGVSQNVLFELQKMWIENFSRT